MTNQSNPGEKQDGDVLVQALFTYDRMNFRGRATGRRYGTVSERIGPLWIAKTDLEAHAGEFKVVDENNIAKTKITKPAAEESATDEDDIPTEEMVLEGDDEPVTAKPKTAKTNRTKK